MKSNPRTKAQTKPNKTTVVQHAVTVPQRLLDDRRREESTLIGALIGAASNPNTDVDKMERLWIIHKEAVAARAEQEFSFAKNALALEIPPIKKNHKIEFKDKNGNLQSTPYANREDIENIIGPIYRRHGFSTEYSTQYVDGKIQTVLIVRHNSGHKEIYNSPPMPLDTTGSKNNNQAAGSTSEYGKRYALIGAFNIIGADIDDDGNTVGNPDYKSQKKSKFDERAESGIVVDVVPDESPELAEIGAEAIEWDGKTIITSPKTKIERAFENAAKAASYLGAVMKKHKHKATRLQLITLNTGLIQHMIKAKLMQNIADLHKIADEGDADNG